MLGFGGLRAEDAGFAGACVHGLLGALGLECIRALGWGFRV